jgi:hypothetical protein
MIHLAEQELRDFIFFEALRPSFGSKNCHACHVFRNMAAWVRIVELWKQSALMNAVASDNDSFSKIVVHRQSAHKHKPEEVSYIGRAFLKMTFRQFSGSGYVLEELGERVD